MTKLYDKCDDFSFVIVNFPFICGICEWSFHVTTHSYAKVCRNYAYILYRARLLTTWLLEQGYVDTRLKSSLHKIYDRHLVLMVYPFAHHENRFVHRAIVFLSSFVYPWHNIVWVFRCVFLRKKKRLPYRCIWSKHPLLIYLFLCTCYFSYFMFCVVRIWFFLCSLSLEYSHLISAWILVPLINLF